MNVEKAVWRGMHATCSTFDLVLADAVAEEKSPVAILPNWSRKEAAMPSTMRRGTFFPIFHCAFAGARKRKAAAEEDDGKLVGAR